MATRSALSTAFILLSGIVLGAVAIGAVRYFAMEGPAAPVHYHANWAIFIDGSRLSLAEPRYMEDVMQCMADPNSQDPEDRVHMHENNQDVVHVHAPGVTWGHLLANIGFAVGDDFLLTDRGRYDSTPERSLKFVLNGSPVRSIRNLPIRDQDRLLISFGIEPVEEVVRAQMPQVGSDAGEYNVRPDPASCSGAVEETSGDRLRRAFWF